MSNQIIGIDLGTSTTEAAVIKNGSPEMIQSPEGRIIIPSAVGQDEEGNWVYGEKAKAQHTLYPERTAIEVKRKIGTGEKISIGGTEYTPVELSAKLLGYVREFVSEELGEDITRAVISVPAYFDDGQRRATAEAGRLAGFTVERLINEPTSAALSYGLSHLDEESHILVYDFGGGTFDVTLLEMFGGVLDVKASHGDNQLGGKDFDEVLIGILLDRFKRRHGRDLSKDPYAMVRIKEEAEKCKIELSEKESCTVQIPMIMEEKGKPLSLDEEITRQEFEDAAKHLIERTHAAIDTVMVDGGVTWDEIDRIILVGGSTRMPMVRSDIAAYSGIEPQPVVDPDHAVAEGAAIQAGIINGEIADEDSVIITDVNPFTLGIMTAYDGGYNLMSVIMPRNTTIPGSRKERYSTHANRQTVVKIDVFQGESDMATENHYLGTFTLGGIPPKKAGKEKIDVEFSYDQNGILQVEATVVSTGQSAGTTINLVEAGHATGQNALQAIEWKSKPLADKYRATLRKAERRLKKLRKEDGLWNEIADIEGHYFYLIRAIEEDDEREAERSERTLKLFLEQEKFEKELMKMSEKDLYRLLNKMISDGMDFDDLGDEYDE